jgi:AraC-like DNA-binding protein
MITALLILSYFGIAQSLLLAVIYSKGYGKHPKNGGLASLFLLFSAAMTVIVLSIILENKFLGMLEVAEYLLTFSAGPIFYLVAKDLRGESVRRTWILILHFTPAFLYLFSTMGLQLSGSTLSLPILIPLLHMQAYSAWVILSTWKNEYHQENPFKVSGHGWLKLLSVMLILFHSAQWIRFSLSGSEYLEFIVPVTGFGLIYVLMFAGFINPSLYAEGTRGALKSEAEHYKHQLVVLENKMRESKIYRNKALTLDLLAGEVQIPSQQISFIINKGLNKNFNEWINEYRVSMVKKMLSKSSNQHYTIDALADEAGFNSRSSFYDAFKKITGTTPTNFRKHN